MSRCIRFQEEDVGGAHVLRPKKLTRAGECLPAVYAKNAFLNAKGLHPLSYLALLLPFIRNTPC